MGSKYDHLNLQELIRLLETRDRRARFGLVWDADEIERDQTLNSDFVALDLVPELSCPKDAAAWRNFIIEGDNFDALRHLRMAFAGQVKCIYVDPPYNTGKQDFLYNDRFVDKEDSWRHSKWCEFMFQRLMLARDLLTPEGVIVVSIDDNEVFSLGLLMNRVFGERAHVATLRLGPGREDMRAQRTNTMQSQSECSASLRTRCANGATHTSLGHRPRMVLG